jgi:hypothetical protein
MPLSLSDQARIIAGNQELPDTTVSFLELVKTQSYTESVNFQINQKDTIGDAEATSYLNKMLLVINETIINNNQVIAQLVSTLVVLGAPNATNLPSTQNGYETFVMDNTFTAMETLGKVTEEEKTAYDALP